MQRAHLAHVAPGTVGRLVLPSRVGGSFELSPFRHFRKRNHSITWIMMLKWPDVLNLARTGNPAPDRKVIKTDAEWRQQLSPEEYRVTRQAGTEHPFSSQMCGLFEPGIYSCVCCETVLFDASEKFESGTGWPSFTQPVALNAIAYRFDGPAFMKRVETVCNTCDAHLGHVGTEFARSSSHPLRDPLRRFVTRSDGLGTSSTSTSSPTFRPSDHFPSARPPEEANLDCRFD
jgi:peptide-methionine (R)-S-oxide reductase